MKPTDYATVADIARLLGTCVRTVRDRYVHRPDFPRPALAPSQRKRQWLTHEVMRWANCSDEAALEAPKPEFPLIEVLFEGMMAKAKYELAVFDHTRSLFYRTRRRAQASGMPFDLELCDMNAFLRRQNFRCAVSGVEFDMSGGSPAGKPFAPSIDRIDSSRGYELDNVRLVCTSVNLMMNEWGDYVFDRLRSGKTC